MIINSPVVNNIEVYYQTNTKNKSFLEVSDFLQHSGISNNKFFLVLFDPTLYNIDPHDPRLNAAVCKKIWYECTRNYWYFIREVVRIEDQGNKKGVPYRLHRGNLAMNFCLMLNLNVFEELPRQFGKTVGVCVRLLWEFLFGTTNSETMLINKKHDDSKLNLKRIKTMRDLLPEYLQLRDNIGVNGQKVKAKDNAESVVNSINGNSIIAKASARNKIMANSLGRGCTQPRQWYDEYGFIPFNKEIYMSAVPAYTTASENAKRNGAPYGILITTTPGDLTTDSGMEAFQLKESATPFSESWYDLSTQDIYELLSKNTDSLFVHIRFTYQQLGAGEAYLARMIKEMRKDWVAIRREVLLEWAEVSDNSPFTRDELDMVKNLIRDPIAKMKLSKYYELNVYNATNMQLNPPIIGVDVSGGYNRDSSAITMIDSKTTKVIADFNCNYISPTDLAILLIELVTKYCPNAVVNIERNGGFGASVIGYLMKSPIKRNLYYEFKEKVIEERYDGFKVVQKKATRKVYGLDSSKAIRDELMEILRQRMENHKDKFISPIIYNELSTLEVKKSGKIEHTSSGHDDQLFSYLMALYVWYNGKNLRENWGIKKTTLTTDQNASEEIVDIEDQYGNMDISDVIQSNVVAADPDNETNIIAQQMAYLDSVKTMTQSEWHTQQFLKDEQALTELIATPRGRKAYREKYDISEDELEMQLRGRGISDIPVSSFKEFYDTNDLDNPEEFKDYFEKKSPYEMYYDSNPFVNKNNPFN